MEEIQKEAILQQVNEFFWQAVAKFAERYNVLRSDVQLLMSFNGEENQYKILKEYAPVEMVKLKDVLGLMKYMAFGSMVGEAVTASIKMFAEKHGASSNEISLMIVCSEGDELAYFVYKDTECLQQTTLNEAIEL